MKNIFRVIKIIIILLGTSEVYAQHPVVWTNTDGVSVDNNSLTKNILTYDFDAEGISFNSILDGTDGWIEMTVEETNKGRMIGFSREDHIDQLPDQIDFAIYLHYSGELRTRENGSGYGPFGTYQSGDVVKVERIGSAIQYKKNGVTFHTSNLTSTGTLYGDITIAELGGTIKNALFSTEAADQGAVLDAQEISALRDLYESTAGANWTDNTGWPADASAWSAVSSVDQTAGWHGVTVTNGDVTELNISSNNLTGPIPSSISDLQELVSLVLQFNNINGLIPTSIGQLSKLKVIALKNNNLTGSIPVEIGDLTLLTDLRLRYNSLSGSIPAELGDLPNLRYLYLAHNQLIDNIPSEIGNLSALQLIFLEHNQLTGSIPPQLGSLPNLQYLFLSYNQLTGSIPSEIVNISKLKYLYLNDNELIGSIPDQIDSLTNLEFLLLHNNQLTGKLPPSLGNLTKLKRLLLLNNQLSGDIPVGLANIAPLQDLLIYDNNFTSLPDFTSHPNKPNLSIVAHNNNLSFENIQQNLIGVDLYNFASYSYTDQNSPIEVLKTPYAIGQDLTLENIRAGGSQTNYQWQEWDQANSQWVVISGATNTNYTFTPTSTENGKRYRCEMTNNWVSGMTLYSNEIELIESRILFTIADGNWTDSSIWSTTKNGTPINEIPGIYDVVTIAGYDVQITSEVTCEGVIIDSSPLGKLEVLGTSAFLTVNGEVKIPSSLETQQEVLVIKNGGKIECK